MCQVLDLDSFIAEKVENMSKAAAALNFILSLAIFTSLPVLLISLKLKNQREKKESSILPVANTDHRHFLIERKQIIAFL